MDVRVRTTAAGVGLAALTLLTACSGDSDADGADGGGDGLTITSPADGAVVDSSFEVAWDSSEELGQPDTGRDHVHVFVDGQSEDYTVVGGNEFTIEGLSPGEHTVNVTLQHADHSSAGEEDEIEVMVEPGGASETPDDESTGPAEPPDDGLGY